MDEIDWWVWALIALAVIALIAIIGVTMRNRAHAKAVERNRHRAGELREEAEVSGIEASQREADAAAARAEAEEARVAAEQLERQAQQHERDAGQVRSEAGERLAKADEIDPDVDDDGVARDTTTGNRGIDGEHVSDDGRRDGQPGGEHVRDTRRDIP